MANQADKIQTGMLDISAVSLPPTDVIPSSTASETFKPLEINLVIGDERPFKRRRIVVQSSLLVGRPDGDVNEPHLDLTTYGGETKGVSRKHAILKRHEAQLFVEDLGSTNGTRINGYQIHPNQPYRLRNGDELEFGLVRAVLSFRE